MSTSPQRLAELNRIIDNALFTLPKATDTQPAITQTKSATPTNPSNSKVIIDDTTQTQPGPCSIKATLFATPKKRSPLEELVGPYLDKYNISLDSDVGKKAISYVADEYLYKKSKGKTLTPNDIEYAVKLRIRESIETDLTNMGYTPQKSRELSLQYTLTPESYALNWASRTNIKTEQTQFTPKENQNHLNSMLAPHFKEYGLSSDSKIASNAQARLKDQMDYYGSVEDKDAAYAVRTAIREDIEAHLLSLGTPKERIYGISREIIRTPGTYQAYAKAQEPKNEALASETLNFTLDEVENFQMPEENKTTLAGQ